MLSSVTALTLDTLKKGHIPLQIVSMWMYLILSIFNCVIEISEISVWYQQKGGKQNSSTNWAKLWCFSWHRFHHWSSNDFLAAGLK